ncbi:MAG: DNA methyltransferase [Polymorphobacter sp.]
MTVSVTLGDCRAVLAARNGPLFDCCVTDPPYHLTSITKRLAKSSLDSETDSHAKRGREGKEAYGRLLRGFMGKEWDGGDIAFRPELWRAVYDQMKPGAHLIAFSGTRTYHRMACAIEDAGFEIRDQLQWLYGSGFPKSHHVSKGIDKAAGVEREIVGIAGKSGSARFCMAGDFTGGEYMETAPATPEAAKWQGWGTALKPACEPICLARKPLSEKSIAANVLKHGTGAINVDACRVEAGSDHAANCARSNVTGIWTPHTGEGGVSTEANPKGRWPANILHDGSEEVLAGFPETVSGTFSGHRNEPKTKGVYGKFDLQDERGHVGDFGSAARFFYSAKAGPLDRIGSAHPTVKPVDVMRWLVRLVTPPGGLILDPFAGSGTTGIAAMAEGFDCELIDLMPDHVADIERKLAFLRGEGKLTIDEHRNGRDREKNAPSLPMLDWLAA